MRYAVNKLTRQPSPEDMYNSIKSKKEWKRTVRPVAKVYNGQCVAPFHYHHFNELLTDMGAMIRTRHKPLLEYFHFPHAASFGRFLASTPKYRATENIHEYV